MSATQEEKAGNRIKSASNQVSEHPSRRRDKMEGASLTRQLSQERVQTPKAVEWNKRRTREKSIDTATEDVI
jgi:hypothetical protein